MSVFNRAKIETLLLGGLPHVPAIHVARVPDIAAKLSDYLSELHKWNKAYNLTAVREPLEMLPRHIYDSLTVLPFLRGQRIIDIGTGAGLPGLVLAICRPDLQFTLLDSNGKKIRFVQHIIATQKFTNVEVVQARAESWEPPLTFDTITCRAYTSLQDFVKSCAHLRTDNGVLLAMKGKYPYDELKELPADWQLSASHPVQVSGLDAERHILQLEPANL